MFLKKKLNLKKHIHIEWLAEDLGSYSVEAALALSAFTALVMMLISLIPIVQVNSVIEHSASEVALELSENAYDTEKFFEEKSEYYDSADWCKELVRERLKAESSNPDRWLAAKGISNGMDGIDFSSTAILDGENEINISLKYEIDINAFGFIKKTISMKKEAKTKAWLPYDFSFESIYTDDSVGIWQQNEFVRGKYFVKRIKDLYPEKGVKSGQGIDLYDEGENKVAEIFSMNVFSKSYLSGDTEINVDAVLEQFEKYISDFEHDIDKLNGTVEMDNGEKKKLKATRKELIVVFPLEAESPIYSGVLDAIFIELNEMYGTEATLYYLEEANYEPG